MVLIWAGRDDDTARAVRDALTVTRDRWLGLDSLGFWGDRAHAPELRARAWLTDVGGVLVRPPGSAGTAATSLARRYVALAADLWAWLDEVETASILNRAAAAVSNECKISQLRVAAEAGFAVPATLVTNDTARALSFCERHQPVVVKSGSGARSIVRRFASLTSDDLQRLGTCPTLFQEYVPGRDVRVHIVGERVFAHRIECAAVDYRYASREGLATEIAVGAVPGNVARQCRQLAKRLQLPLAGVDLRETCEGEWYCFEINPAPAFAFYESRAMTGIARAVAWRLAQRGAPQERANTACR